MQATGSRKHVSSRGTVGMRKRLERIAAYKYIENDQSILDSSALPDTMLFDSRKRCLHNAVS